LLVASYACLLFDIDCDLFIVIVGYRLIVSDSYLFLLLVIESYLFIVIFFYWLRVIHLYC